MEIRNLIILFSFLISPEKVATWRKLFRQRIALGLRSDVDWSGFAIDFGGGKAFFRSNKHKFTKGRGGREEKGLANFQKIC
jgi:hypothetical protein